MTDVKIDIQPLITQYFAQAIQVDDQPIDATLFAEGKWLTSFITPQALEIEKLHHNLTEGIHDSEDRLIALWDWVASQVEYIKFVKARVSIGGNSFSQDDYWTSPSITRRIQVGNCATQSFLLASLLRNELPPSQVYCVLGNLYNGTAGGHAWVSVMLGGDEYIMESTRYDAPAIVPAIDADRYEAVHYFNDESVLTIEGKTVMTPFTACYSSWLTDYLDWAYIEGAKG